MPSWHRHTGDSPAGLRNTLLPRAPPDKQLRPSVNRGHLDMLSLGENWPGQTPESKGPSPAGLSRAQVRTDGEDLSGCWRDEEARVGPWVDETSCSDSATCSVGDCV